MPQVHIQDQNKYICVESVCLTVCLPHVVTLSYKSDPYLPLCFADDTCIPRNAATIFPIYVQMLP